LANKGGHMGWVGQGWLGARTGGRNLTNPVPTDRGGMSWRGGYWEVRNDGEEDIQGTKVGSERGRQKTYYMAD
jgi:hypothetical protein